MEFENLVRDQARAYDPDQTPHEHVEASVQRLARFTNRGSAASGHIVAVDEPKQFGGGGTAADPAELLLTAIGASLSVTLTFHAAVHGIDLDGVEVGLTGKLDPGRFFRPTEGPGGGIFDLFIDVKLRTRAPSDAIHSLLDQALLACPVLRSISTIPVVRLTSGQDLTEPARS